MYNIQLNKKQRNLRWTDAEKRILLKNRPNMSWEELTKLLPRHSANSIKNQCQRLGITRRKSTD